VGESERHGGVPAGRAPRSIAAIAGIETPVSPRSRRIVPSYIAKLDRAERHLADLTAAIERYGGTDKATRPYTVRARSTGFTSPGSSVNTGVPLIVADAIYNLRSSLDHLMGPSSL
jgi:hypothetical protein